jgi:hypothetical protein
MVFNEETAKFKKKAKEAISLHGLFKPCDGHFLKDILTIAL